jgi:hypothetical protein
VSRPDALRAVKLLGEKRAHQQVRPGEGAEGKRRVGAGEDGGIKALRAPDQEADWPPAAEPALDEAG